LNTENTGFCIVYVYLPQPLEITVQILAELCCMETSTCLFR